MEDIALDILNAWNVGDIGLDMEPGAYRKMRTIIGAFFSALTLIPVLDAMFPFLALCRLER